MVAPRWTPPVEPSAAEKKLLARCKKAKLFPFLRAIRHLLFNETFQADLCALYPERAAGRVPVAPAMLAMVTLLQAALGVSDQDAVFKAETDLAWQLVLGTLGLEGAPFSQGSLFNFRQRLIEHDFDRRLLERTIELAKETGLFGHHALRAAFDASPLFGVGRVEDTFNLIGHALRDLLQSAAARMEVPFEEAAQRAGVDLLLGKSVKAALDIDWQDPAQKRDALHRLLSQVEAASAFLKRELTEECARPPLSHQLQTLERLIAQDTEPDPDGGGKRIKEGVARERQISISDPQMRHGRKSKSSRVDGYKRHLACDLTSKLILAAAVLPANRPESEAAGWLFADLQRQGLHPEELFIDLGYLGSEDVHYQRSLGMRVHSKAFPLRNGELFTKAAFTLDFDRERVRCPAGQETKLVLGHISRFPKDRCAQCDLRSQCTTATRGRSLAIHPEERFLAQQRARQRTPEGRALLRVRTTVEHSHAAIGRTQGRKARYRSVRKNTFDVRRHAAVQNLFAILRAA